MTRYDELEHNQEGALTDADQLELIALRKEADRFMLCKAQAAISCVGVGIKSLRCNPLCLPTSPLIYEARLTKPIAIGAATV